MYSTYQIFEPKQHYLTTVYRNRNRNAKRIRVKSVDQLERLVDNQPKDSDLYITKYGKDGVVWNIILDFDSEDDKGVAWMDCLVLSQFLERKGIRCVIVDSTNKGYHLYVQIPPTNFTLFNFEPIEEPSLFFKHYIKSCASSKLSTSSVDTPSRMIIKALLLIISVRRASYAVVRSIPKSTFKLFKTLVICASVIFSRFLCLY